MDIPADGCPDAINATGYSFGPSWRMVVSLEDKVKAHAVYPGGQSGNPASKFYKNMVETWTKGQYYALDIHANAEEKRKNQTQSIILNPAK
jgi:penicillin amidase